MQLRRANGSLINAEITIEERRDSGGTDVIVHSRGGARGSAAERNPDYFEALEELLRLLGQADAVVTAICVDSNRVRRLPESERQLDLSFPIKLSRIRDLDRLRKDITRAQQWIGQTPGAKGGNSTKRIRIRLDPCAALSNRASTETWLGGDRKQSALRPR